MLRARLAAVLLQRRGCRCAFSLAAASVRTAKAAPTAKAAQPALRARLSTVAPPASRTSPPAMAPAGEPQQTDLGELGAALGNSNARWAVQVFRRMSQANSPDLASISAEHFAALVGIAAFNVDKALAHMAVETRMQLALQVFGRMLSLGIQPTQDAYTAAIRAHSYLGNTAAIEALVAEMASKGMDTSHPTVLMAVMFDCIAAGNETKGRSVFATLAEQDPSPRPYNNLMAAYSASGNEQGMLAVFAELKASSRGANAHSYEQLCSHYSRLSDNAHVQMYYDEFRQTGGVPTRKLCATALGAANNAGNHHAALAMIKELRAMGIVFNNNLLTEEAVALAATGDQPGAWKALKACTSKFRVMPRMATTIAGMLGPMSTPAAVAGLKATIAAMDLPEARTLFTVMSGYSLMGDLESVKALYALVQARLASQHNEHHARQAYAIAVQAFENAGDLAGLDAFRSSRSSSSSRSSRSGDDARTASPQTSSTLSAAE